MKAYGFILNNGSGYGYDRKADEQGHPKRFSVGVKNVLRHYKKIARRFYSEEDKRSCLDRNEGGSE